MNLEERMATVPSTAVLLGSSLGPVLRLLPRLGTLGPRSQHDGLTPVLPWPPLGSTVQPHFRFCYITPCLFLRVPVTCIWLCPCPPCH